MSKTRTMNGGRLVALAGLVLLGTLAGGCYERVVAVRGIGSSAVTVEEPYQESGQLDRWVFGDEPSSKQERRQRD
jgi:hypothetical protein